MVYFYFSFISILIKDIFEDERARWAEGCISCLPINIGSYQEKRVLVFNGSSLPCLSVCLGRRFKCLVAILNF